MVVVVDSGAGGGLHVGLLVDSQFLELFEAPDVLGVVLGNVVEPDAGMRWFGVPALRDGSHSALVPAAVADHHDVREPAGGETPRDVGEHHLEGVLGEAERSGKAHVAGRRVVIALRHQLDDGSDQRAPEPPGDGLGGGPQHDVVLAGDHVGAVLFDAAGRDDRSGGAVRDAVADLHPGQFLDEDAVEGGDGPLRVEGVPGMVLGPAAESEERREENEERT